MPAPIITFDIDCTVKGEADDGRAYRFVVRLDMPGTVQLFDTATKRRIRDDHKAVLRAAILAEYETRKAARAARDQPMPALAETINGRPVLAYVARCGLRFFDTVEGRAHAEAFRTEDAWEEELARCFPAKRLGDIRFQPAGQGEPGSELRRLWSACRDAKAAWLAEVQAARAAVSPSRTDPLETAAMAAEDASRRDGLGSFRRPSPWHCAFARSFRASLGLAPLEVGPAILLSRPKRSPMPSLDLSTSPRALATAWRFH